jgi:hypothetical protein
MIPERQKNPETKKIKKTAPTFHPKPEKWNFVTKKKLFWHKNARRLPMRAIKDAKPLKITPI